MYIKTVVTRLVNYIFIVVFIMKNCSIEIDYLLYNLKLTYDYDDSSSQFCISNTIDL